MRHAFTLSAVTVLLVGCSASEPPPLIQESQTSSVSTTQSATASSSIASRTVWLVSPEGTEVSVSVEDARTPEEQARGLMERTELAEDHGMLFTFPEPRALSFWMKNTLIPLDILYFGADGVLLSYASMTPCTAEPCTLYPSNGLALTALEVPAGSVRDWGISEGWKLEQ